MKSHQNFKQKGPLTARNLLYVAAQNIQRQPQIFCKWSCDRKPIQLKFCPSTSTFHSTRILLIVEQHSNKNFREGLEVAYGKKENYLRLEAEDENRKIIYLVFFCCLRNRQKTRIIDDITISFFVSLIFIKTFNQKNWQCSLIGRRC